MQTRTSGGASVRARRHRLLATTALISLALLPAAPQSADAQTVWNGSVSSDWNTNGNWSTNAVPTAADNVTINTISPNSTEINAFAASSNQLFISNDGALSIINGGSLSASNHVEVGAGGAGVGSLSLDTNSTLTSTGVLGVGTFGTGTATIAGGSDASGLVGRIGGAVTGIGTVTVTGSGSTWSTTNEFDIGYNGQGVLLIQNGGAVTAGTQVHLGTNSTAVGTVTVDGSGSSLIATSFLGVGQDGQGTLNVINGGGVTTNFGYIGANIGSSGTVIVDGAGSTWNVTLLNVGESGAGALTIANGGSVTAGTFVIANSAGSTGTLNIGNGGAAGTVNAASVVFGAGTGALNFNHADTNYTFAPGLSGNGTVNHLAGVTTLTGNSATFTGTTNVSGGSLYVNGTLDGTVNVTGGTLGGSGTLTGALTIGSGGNVAPGNSVGTLNVASQTFNAGSTYKVELNDGGNTAGVNNDHINATGTVTINGGTVHVTPENGTDTGTTYAVGTVYTIITAAGGVTGAFTTLTDNYAYLNFSLSNDANNVFLTSQLAATSFCLPGMTGNQCAAGKGAFSLGAGTLYTAVLNLSNAEAPGALNQLSGEIHSSAKTALIEDSHFVRDAALNRIRSAFESVAASSMPIFAYAPGGPQPAPASTDRFAIWGQAFGGFGHIKSDGNAAKLDRNSGGLLIGGDGQVAEHWRLGAFGGYSRSKFDADARNSSGSSDNYHAGIYGGSEWGAFGLRYGGAYTWHDIDIARSVAFTGFSDRLAGSYRAGTAQVFGEVGYRLSTGGVRYEPFANLAYVNLRTNGFSEAGGAAALVAPGQSTDTTFSTLGVRAETTFVTGQSQTTLRGILGWRHAFGDVAPTSTMTFAAGSSAFTTAGVPIAQDALVLDAGFDVTLTPTTILGFSYGGQFGSGVTDQSVKGMVRIGF